MKKLLYILILAMALIAVMLDSQDNSYYKVFVSLTTAFILLAAILFGNKKNTKYLKFIALGLGFCALADIIPFYLNNFVWEISAYILAKAIFAEAFRSYGALKFNFKIIGVLSLVGISLFIYLSSAFGEFLVPMGLYLGMMIYMSWTGIALHKSGKMKNSKWLLLSIILWFVCELLSGLDRFGLDSMLIVLLVHLTYWLALGFIALSAMSEPFGMKVAENAYKLEPSAA